MMRVGIAPMSRRTMNGIIACRLHHLSVCQEAGNQGASPDVPPLSVASPTAQDDGGRVSVPAYGCIHRSLMFQTFVPLVALLTTFWSFGFLRATFFHGERATSGKAFAGST